MVLETLFGEEGDVLREPRFQLLLFASVNGAMGIVLVSPILEALTGPFGVDEVGAGLLITAFVAPAIVGVPVLGALADRLGRRPVLSGSLAVVGIAGVAIAATTDYRVVLGLRVLQGFASGGIIPVAIASLGDFYDGAEEATAQGLRFTATGIVQAAVPIAAGALVGLAWQFPFLLYALAIPVAALVFLRFEEPATGDGDGREGYVRDLLWLLARPRVAATLAALMMPVFTYVTFLAYNSFLVVRVLGGTAGQAGVLLAVVNAAYALATSQAGRIDGFFDRRATPLVGAFAVLAVGMSTFGHAPNLLVAGAACAFMSVGGGLSASLLFSAVNARSPDAFRAGVVSVGQMVTRASTAVAPVAVGALIAALEAGLGNAAAIRNAFVVVGVTCAALGSVAIVLSGVAPPVPDDDAIGATGNPE
jgi:MFS family permease